MHHRLDASPERAEPSQAQQVQGGSSQGGHHPGAIAPVAVGTLMELDVTDPLSALNTPAVAHQLQQCFWRRAQARQEQVVGVKGFAITGTAGRDFHDPAGADSDLADVLWSLLGAQRPGDVAAVADFVIHCHKREVTLSLELRSDLAVQRLLVGFHGQEEVGSLLLELPKNGRCVWRASAWMSTPSRSSSPSSWRSTAHSWFSPVA